MNNCGVDGWKERAVLREAGIPWKDVSTKRKGDEVVYTVYSICQLLWTHQYNIYIYASVPTAHSEGLSLVHHQ